MASRWDRRAVAVSVALLGLFLVSPSSPRGEEQTKGPTGTHPQQVLIIRHAEKPPDEAGSVHLSPEGQKRAAALPMLFQAAEKRPNPFPTPEVIFATKDSKHSHRPGETVAALAKRLKLAVNASYEDEEFDKLAHGILHNPKFANKTILICWHHGTIPQLARRLKAVDAPDSWKGTVFDRVWQITYDKDGQTTFRDRPQQLLAQDAEK